MHWRDECLQISRSIIIMSCLSRTTNAIITVMFAFSDFSISGNDGSGDIYPEQQVGVGDYGGEVKLTSDGMKIDAGNESASNNDTDMRRRRRDAAGEFYMEPGR